MCEDEDFKKEFEDNIPNEPVDDDSDSDTMQEQTVIQSINEDVFIEQKEFNEPSRAQVTRDEQKEYILQIKKDLEEEYKNDIAKLQEMVIKQDAMIKELQKEKSEGHSKSGKKK